MNFTATEAKNRLGHILEQAQAGPIFIQKAGKPHSVVISMGQYEALLKAGSPERITSAEQFYRQHQQWVDEQNHDFDRHGLWNDELRIW